jgi:ABC-type sugar transport system permease subunit
MREKMEPMKLTTEPPARETALALKRTLSLPFPTLPYQLLLPSILLIFIIEFYPFIIGTVYSLHKGTLLKTGAFIGLDNYVHLFNRFISVSFLRFLTSCSAT